MHNLRIFHIDDHQLFSNSFKKVVEESYPNAELYSFINSDKALAYIMGDLKRDKIVDVIVTDYTHHGINAIEFAQLLAILKNEHKVDIPVVLLTMKQENEEIQSAITSGHIDAYVSKSASTDELIHALENLLYQKRLQ